MMVIMTMMIVMMSTIVNDHMMIEIHVQTMMTMVIEMKTCVNEVVVASEVIIVELIADKTILKVGEIIADAEVHLRHLTETGLLVAVVVRVNEIADAAVADLENVVEVVHHVIVAEIAERVGHQIVAADEIGVVVHHLIGGVMTRCYLKISSKRMNLLLKVIYDKTELYHLLIIKLKDLAIM